MTATSHLNPQARTILTALANHPNPTKRELHVCSGGALVYMGYMLTPRDLGAAALEGDWHRASRSTESRLSAATHLTDAHSVTLEGNALTFQGRKHGTATVTLEAADAPQHRPVPVASDAAEVTVASSPRNSIVLRLANRARKADSQKSVMRDVRLTSAGGQLVVEATDQYRALRAPFDTVTGALPDGDSIVIPGPLVHALVAAKEWTLAATSTTVTATFPTADWAVTTVCVADDFPPLQALWERFADARSASNPDSVVSVPTEALATALRSAPTTTSSRKARALMLSCTETPKWWDTRASGHLEVLTKPEVIPGGKTISEGVDTSVAVNKKHIAEHLRALTAKGRKALPTTTFTWGHRHQIAHLDFGDSIELLVMPYRAPLVTDPDALTVGDCLS